MLFLFCIMKYVNLNVDKRNIRVYTSTKISFAGHDFIVIMTHVIKFNLMRSITEF